MHAPTLPDSCEALLAQMVAIDTVNPHCGGRPGGEAALAALLESLAQGWGLSTRRCPVAAGAFNLLVTAEAAAADAEWLLFESHLDTVAVTGMTIEPWTLCATGERLSGRGACDTKGSGAAMLWALRDYARAAARPRHVGVVFTVDEEARMTGARAFARDGLPALLPRLRGIVVGEPTGLRPVVAHNGVVRWRTITRGVAAHSARPALGRSAISTMVRVVAALEERFVPAANRPHPLTGGAAASVNVIRGGTQVNVIPDYCEIECDRRLAPGEPAAETLAARDAVLAGLPVEHDSLYVVPPLDEICAWPLHAWMQPAFAAAGLDGAAAGAGYVTDASHYAAAGAATLVLGPGDVAQAHTPDEWLDRGQLAAAVRLYGALMRLA
jgi:acetylornithine deacetylase